MDNVVDHLVALPAAAAHEPSALVVVRPAVVENADHVFGNLFQRVYAGVSRLQQLDPTEGDSLATSVREVEEALQLVLDYVAPFPPSFERFAVAEVAESLAHRIKDIAGAAVAMVVEVTSEGAVLADPARLGRAFDLLAQRFAERARGERAEIAVEIAPDSVQLRLACSRSSASARSSIGDLRWAVAEKLIELQGGTLEFAGGEGGSLQWMVSLPREA